MAKETFIGLEEAYDREKERVANPDLFYLKELREKRKANGMCESCGKKRITKNQKKRGLVNCWKCREDKNEKARNRRSLCKEGRRRGRNTKT